MGNQLCKRTTHDMPLIQDIHNHQGHSVNRQKFLKVLHFLRQNRVEVDEFPIVSNKHVDQAIKKLSKKASSEKSKIWRVNTPFQLYYMNLPKFADDLPKDYCVMYKLKENGDFAGYFEGYIDDNQKELLKGSIYVFYNASFFIGVDQNHGVFTNEVSGLRYEGGWADEMPQGQGKEKSNKGQYEGSYNLGEKEGHGKFVWSDIGVTYEGEFLKGLFHNKGKINDLPNNYQYQGQFSCGQKSGRGIQKTQTEIYEGEFSNGNRSGQGILTTYSNSSKIDVVSVFVGRFQNNLPNGRGTFSAKETNQSIQGIWQKGILKAVL